MTHALLELVAHACASALSADSWEAAQAALGRAQVALVELRSLQAPRSRHRRVAEGIYDLTRSAFDPARLGPGFGTVADEFETADAARVENQWQVVSRRARAENAIRRALEA